MSERAAIVVGTSVGLELFSPETAQFDDEGTPTNLMPGTEFATLNSEQTHEYGYGGAEIRLQDETRYVGAFAIVFTFPPSEVESQTSGRNK